ncbi:MAG: hypothetical protein IT374_25055 [Polyangiaceae bacterium]|nr:hypothetical protein [Polyangiaceae bacterium]
MDQAHLATILGLAGGAAGADGFTELPDGKSITWYVAHAGASMNVSKSTACKLDGALLVARNHKGEVYVVALADVFGAALEGGSAVPARRAGFAT